MKSCKKYLFPLVAFALCMTMLFSAPAIVVGAQDTTAVVAEPTEPSKVVTSELDVDGIVGEIIGDVDPEVGEDIMDGVYETQSVLTYITKFIDKLSNFFGVLLNAILGGFSLSDIF